MVGFSLPFVVCLFLFQSMSFPTPPFDPSCVHMHDHPTPLSLSSSTPQNEPMGNITPEQPPVPPSNNRVGGLNVEGGEDGEENCQEGGQNNTTHQKAGEGEVGLYEPSRQGQYPPHPTTGGLGREGEDPRGAHAYTPHPQCNTQVGIVVENTQSGEDPANFHPPSLVGLGPVRGNRPKGGNPRGPYPGGFARPQGSPRGVSEYSFGETFPPIVSICLEEIFLGILDPPRVVANFLRITSGTLSTVGRVWGQFWHCMDQFWQKKTLVEALELPTTFVNNSAPEKKGKLNSTPWAYFSGQFARQLTSFPFHSNVKLLPALIGGSRQIPPSKVEKGDFSLITRGCLLCAGALGPGKLFSMSLLLHAGVLSSGKLFSMDFVLGAGA